MNVRFSFSNDFFHFSLGMTVFFRTERWNVMESLKQSRRIRKGELSSSLGKEHLYPNSKPRAVSITCKNVPEQNSCRSLCSLGHSEDSLHSCTVFVPGFREQQSRCSCFSSPLMLVRLVNPWGTAEGRMLLKSSRRSWCFMGFLWRDFIFFNTKDLWLAC